MPLFEATLNELSETSASVRCEGTVRPTGGVAHDLNNLLTVILGAAELLEDSLEGRDGLRELATLARTAAEQGAELTDRLLASTRSAA
jgi:signal transduction histidine kinase